MAETGERVHLHKPQDACDPTCPPLDFKALFFEAMRLIEDMDLASDPLTWAEAGHLLDVYRGANQ